MWLFENKVISSIDEMPQDTYGFIYLVTHIPTNRKYIGKKVLYFERNVKLGKRELNELKAERKANVAKKTRGSKKGKQFVKNK